LDALQLPWLSLTGDTSPQKRGALVRKFQAKTVPILLVSLKAGGVGLNLTAADTVIHVDPWWNPAVEAQATARAHRLGQDQPVFVYKLVVEGSIEERMLELQARKAALAEGRAGQRRGRGGQIHARRPASLAGAAGPGRYRAAGLTAKSPRKAGFQVRER
jgi:SNF2 family DNA or RNA helicase